MKNLLATFLIFYGTLSFAQSAGHKIPPPTSEQVRTIFAQLWEQSWRQGKTPTAAQLAQNPWKNPANKIKVKQCQSVDDALTPTYFCDFVHFPSVLFPNLPESVQSVIKQPISFRFEQNSWHLKAPLRTPPTEEEIKTALDQIWLLEKIESLNYLIKNRKITKDYAPSPGYSLSKKESDKEHQKRLKAVEKLPDHPFAEHKLRLNKCVETPHYQEYFYYLSTYRCELNTDDLEAIFPVFAKSSVGYHLTAIYYNKQWIIGDSNLDPLLSTFQNMHNYDGCIVPIYRPKQWNQYDE